MSNAKKVVVRNKGHITIPKEMRDELNISENSVLEAHIIGKSIVLTTQKTSISIIPKNNTGKSTTP